MTALMQNGRGKLVGLPRVIGKFLRHSLLLFFFLIIACAVWLWLYGPQNYPGFQGSASTSAEKMHIRINEHDYWMPRYYIDTLSNNNTIEQSGVLIFANMPDLTPRIKEKSDLELAFKNMDYFISIHVQDIRNLIKLSESYAYAIGRSHYKTYDIYKEGEGKRYGLNFVYKLDPYSKKVAEDKSDYGKTFYTINNNPENGYIECLLYVKNPMCIDKFEIEKLGLTLEINYDLNYFPEWKKNRQKVTDFIRSFTSPPAPTEK